MTEETELKEKYIEQHVPHFVFYLANLGVFIFRALPMNITVLLDLLRYFLWLLSSDINLNRSDFYNYIKVGSVNADFRS